MDKLSNILNGFYRERRALESLNLKSKIGAVEVYVKFKKQIKQWAKSKVALSQEQTIKNIEKACDIYLYCNTKLYKGGDESDLQRI